MSGSDQARARAAKRKLFFEEQLVANLVAARMAGMPAEKIDEYRKLKGREQFNKRQQFEYWINQIDKNNGSWPLLMGGGDWLSWAVVQDHIRREKRRGSIDTARLSKALDRFNTVMGKSLSQKYLQPLI